MKKGPSSSPTENKTFADALSRVLTAPRQESTAKRLQSEKSPANTPSVKVPAPADASH